MQKKGIAVKLTATVLALSMVVAAVPKQADAAAKKPVLNKTELTMEKGDKEKLKVKTKGNKLSKIKWKSANSKIAKVSKKGVVTAGDSGSTVVKAVFKVKGEKKKTTLKCDVFVLEQQLAGGWETAADPTITPEIADMMKKAQENLVGVNYEPFALLATQVVAGMNYRVFCRATLVTAKPESYYAIVDVYEDLEKKVSDATVVATTKGSQEAFPVAASGSAVGGMTQAESPVIDPDYLEKFNVFKLPNGGTLPFRPVALLATQVVAGINAVVICERDSDDEDGSLVYQLVSLNLGVDGKATLLDTVPVTPTDADYSVCTNLAPTVVERFASSVKVCILKKDWDKLSTMIAYPIELKKDLKAANAEEFKDIMSKNNLNQKFSEAVRLDDTVKMFARDQGVMLGADGEIWMNEKDGAMKITAINGIIA
ncbi:MAG: Ig-like domain-containing protein [Eubacterium sp.]|nr:Ig-like domain-containing protein [Eubacterium sp.]